MNDPMQLAINEVLRARDAAVFQHLLGGSLDSKRPKAWQEYGYKDELSQEDFYNLYDRHALAHGAVDLLRDTTWQNYPDVIEGDEAEDVEAMTAWDKSVAALAKKIRLWQAYKLADSYRMVTGFSALILQYADSKKWDQPVDAGNKLLLKVLPAWSTTLTPGSLSTDEASPRYGEPVDWQFVEAPLNGKAQGRQVTIHPDRIIILGDWRNPRSMYRAPFNNFVNVEKIEGGSGESFLKNAARQLAVDFDKSVNMKEIAKAHGVAIEDLQKLFNKTADEVNRGNDLLFITQGATTTPLVATVSDPQPHYEINVSSIAAAFGIPVKALIGMQTGERASTEDLKQLNKRAQGYRDLELSDEITDVVKKIASAGALPSVPNEITVIWQDLTDSTPAEKLEQVAKMADVNQKMVAIGQVFTQEEMRTTAGFDNDEELPPLPEPIEPPVAIPPANNA